jgi:hypothetical protein
MTWLTVYDIRQDAERVRQIQEATLNRPGFGLVPEPALFGSDEWWRAIDDGRVTAMVEEGVVGVVRWGSMGDWPVWLFRSADGTESEWAREGDYTRYVEGLPARITTVITRWKADSSSVRMGRPAAHSMLIKVELEDIDARSARAEPGPFGVGS